MKKSIVLFILAVAFAGCSPYTVDMKLTQVPDDDVKVFGANLPENHRDAERLNIYVSEEVASELEQATGEDGLVRFPDVKSIQNPGIVKMRRMFPEAGKFEARTRLEGLHRWYEVYYDASSSLTKAAMDWTAIPGVEMVEFVPLTQIAGTPVVVPEEQLTARQTSSGNLPFDDPRLNEQWHYYNNGTVASSVSGCDINVFPVWKRYTTGSESVIVAVVDGGIDFKHEDLAANMWENPEKSGDFRFGYNFCNDSYQVTPDQHGTHVAGTIGAVNNNGIGVCGVAGGDAKAGVKGVRLMSCQIFEGDNGSGQGPAAIKWSADNGAVISQNSWGYIDATETPSSLKAAVDYFIKYAGIDENGVQTGPMRGGFVLFSAGNENTNASSSVYDHIFSVAAVGADFRRAHYSNYGEWVDISAPGGDVKKGNQILSTFPGNKYGYYQGTSMACPHVSGVAALIVSKFGGEGFTPAELERRLRESATPIQSYNRSFLMGEGLVNAYGAIAGQGGAAPDDPTSFLAETQSNNLNFSVSVPKDSDDGIPSSIVVYYKTASFSAISGDLMFAQFYLDDNVKPGSSLTGTITGLEFNQKYYVAAAAKDLAGNLSGLTEVKVVTTGENSAPTIQAINGTSVSLKAHESKSLAFEIVDPDNHFFTIDLQRESEGVVLDTLVRNQPKIVFNGPEIPGGAHNATLIVTDTYGASVSQKISYTILENHAPVVAKRFEDRVYNSRAAVTEEFNCSDYFMDEDGEELKYTISISDERVINLTSQDGKFFLTPMSYGYATITVTGTDVRGESASQSFRVLIRDGEQPVDIYPNPVSDYLYVRTSEAAAASLRVISVSGATVHEDNLTITPFDPAKVDVRSFAPGVYTVLLDYNGEQIKKSIVKL